MKQKIAVVIIAVLMMLLASSQYIRLPTNEVQIPDEVNEDLNEHGNPKEKMTLYPGDQFIFAHNQLVTYHGSYRNETCGSTDFYFEIEDLGFTGSKTSYTFCRKDEPFFIDRNKFAISYHNYDTHVIKLEIIYE